MIAVLTENFGGKWPFWLSPRQVMVVPVAPPFNDYALHVKKAMHDAGFCSDADTDDSNTMNKKVRNAQIAQYNFIFGELLFVILFLAKNK
jgi:threonyl-tRNA synthetase